MRPNVDRTSLIIINYMGIVIKKVRFYKKTFWGCRKNGGVNLVTI